MYKLYNVYMYTVTEFRKNLRQAFADAREGHEVVIGGYGETKYQLVALMRNPLPGHSFESVPKEKPRLKEPKEYFEIADDPGSPVREVEAEIRQVIPSWTPCKHGADPAFCKFAKYDKNRKQKWCK